MLVRFLPRLFVLLLILLCLAGGCRGKKRVVEPVCPQITASESPEQFSAGLSLERQGLRRWQDLTTSIAKSLAYVQSKPESRVALRYCDETITWDMITKSLRHLLLVLPELNSNPSLLAREFRWVPIGNALRYGSYSSDDLRAKGTKFARQGKGVIHSRLDPFSSLAVNTDDIPLGAIVAYRIIVGNNAESHALRALGFAHDVCRPGKDIEIFCGRERETRRLATAMQGEALAWILLER